VGLDSKTNKHLPFIIVRDVGDDEEGIKPIEMSGDSLGVWFVTKSCNVAVEKKKRNLKLCGGLKGTIAIINDNSRNWEKVWWSF
jgi:hypothetical protein